MLTYRLPQFIDYLNHHYTKLYEHYLGRLIELFPSFRANDENLMIVHDASDQPADDEKIMQLWKEFSAGLNK
ncbi:MAG TPA: hypothetical protein VGB71_01755 [Flavisolibacter sp.]|jgi:uncharacterized membrane-anchored protein YhcB (DUF1043 family)